MAGSTEASFIGSSAMLDIETARLVADQLRSLTTALVDLAQAAQLIACRVEQMDHRLAQFEATRAPTLRTLQ